MSEVSPVSGASALADAVGLLFSGAGAVARALPEFEPRPAQREMAEAVAQTFADGGVLLAEAGTGTGKTLAYLAPAILSRHRVLVSTGTKNLQEQIYFKDIPLLRDALGVPFTATYMKGRANYLCLHRFEQFREATRSGPRDLIEISDSARRVFLPIVERWVATTETGDRAEIEDLPEDLPFWSDISATSETCLGTTCPQYHECFVTRMRQRAADSDVVIVNHHLLCADAAVRQSAFGEVIPSCAFAVIDEAHQLEDVATQYFGVAVSNYRVEELARDVERVLATARMLDERGDLAAAVERLRERSRLFFGALQLDLAASAWPTSQSQAPASLAEAMRRPGGDDLRVRIREGSLASASEEAGMLSGALENLEAVIRLLKPPGDGAPAPEVKERLDDLLAMAARAAVICDELRFVTRARDAEYVYYVELRGRGVFLRAAPIDVSALVRELVIEGRRAVVFTSATLAIEGSFEYVRSRLGIQRARELLLPSEFDYPQQAVLYLPPRMPDPRNATFADAAAREVVEILRRTAGRAFVLFTSYAMLRRVQRIAEEALDYPILVQGTAPRSVLLRQFRTTPHSVLLATASFWQGVDVVGEALSCVIIDKLPFASPGDPITAARIEAIAARGGQPFLEYQVPLAILTLKQGLGRLIRHRRDRGVLAILDPRLRTMRYGQQFLDALPRAPITSSLRDIERFFET